MILADQVEHLGGSGAGAGQRHPGGAVRGDPAHMPGTAAWVPAQHVTPPDDERLGNDFVL